MRIVLGGPPKSDDEKFSFASMIYEWALVQVGTIVGCIIALIFILFDVFYLNKKFQNNSKATLFRFNIISLIAIIVGGTHYILEKVINVI
ncbi:hypothetical protein PXD56_13635 [Maribacter sp. SA7]|uniref:hypothetical protein n=1 Tax=Maribacter zhoushanensis TaxID=3030012 RepID=UPI0023EBF6F5|nr:hypothetical protein [Maribacter zhoushanensis]MDF4204009.1 hypothetical protein [Maribacter zhoushanensis]